MNNVSIVMYHYIRNLRYGRYGGIKGLEIEQFKEQINFLRKNFNIIKMEDLINAVDNHTKLPEKAVLLTFDDGYAEHFYTVFPILDSLKLQGSFFFPTRTFCENKLLDVNKVHFILASADIDNLYNETLLLMDKSRKEGWEFASTDELIKQYAVPNRFDDGKTVFIKRILQTVLPEELRGIISTNLFEKYVGLPEDVFARELYMNRDHISCMQRNGMYIGIHGYNHYWLGNMTKEEQVTEINKALDSLDGIVDRNNWVMNYPYGSYNQDTLDILEKMNCKLALCTKVDICDLDKYGKYELPRFDTNDYPPKSENYKNYEENDANKCFSMA